MECGAADLKECFELLVAGNCCVRQLQGVELRQRLQQLSQALQAIKGCDNSGREQLVAALPAQLDAQGWGVQQVGQGEGAAGQGQQAPGPKLHDPASDVIQQLWQEVQQPSGSRGHLAGWAVPICC
ncbi:hypothetical protein HaLaN_24639 [Haematococcus lacustris]|uniref:Uncharacterized protein n=1 Tax=Haematococcus lacustris TaxID=44745 RepID=A0A6A0A4V3_HAELA|nr:hypothetical protein HaLaN_24639 [Haematococcus lacustris]